MALDREACRLRRKRLTTARGEALSIYMVRISCPKCGMQQTFHGTPSEIGAAVEVWSSGHQHVTRNDESDAPAESGRRSRTPGRVVTRASHWTAAEFAIVAPRDVPGTAARLPVHACYQVAAGRGWAGARCDEARAPQALGEQAARRPGFRGARLPECQERRLGGRSHPGVDLLVVGKQPVRLGSGAHRRRRTRRARARA